MAGLKSLVTVFGLLCVVLSNNPLGVGAQETTVVPSPGAPNTTEINSTPNAGEPNVPAVNKPEEQPGLQSNSQAGSQQEPKPEVKPGSQEEHKPETKPGPQEEHKPEIKPSSQEEHKPETKPGSQEEHKPESSPQPATNQDTKINAQAGEKGKQDGKGSAATLYTNCGLSVLFGAILLRL